MDRAQAARRHIQAAQRTSLIGHEHEVEAIRNVLLERQRRLVTLTGAAGCGKTRLAADVVEYFPDGVWVVELGATAHPSLVHQVIAAAEGVRERPDRPLLDALFAYLKPRQLLLVLDNCEQLIVACAHPAEGLLDSCPTV